MDPRIRQRLMGQGQGVDAVPDNLFSQATAAAQAVPQDQQLEAQDETPDTTTDDTTPPAVPPAPDTPPEVAVANSQTNEQADGKTPPNTPTTPAAPPMGVTLGDAQPPPPEPSGGPNYAQLADVARRARGQDYENINRWNLGEGLKEAFAIARGQHYSGRPYGGTLEEPAVEKEQANTQKRIQDYLTRKRQGEIDTRQGKLVESEIGKNNAEAAKALRQPSEKPLAGETDYQKSLIDLRARDQQLREEEIARKKKDAEDALKRKGAGAAAASEGLKIPFPGGEFSPVPGRAIPKEQVSKARDHASQLGGAVSQMDDLAGTMEGFVKHPGVLDKSALNTKVRITAQAISQAIGSGAMNNEEARAYSDILGVNLTTPGALESMIDKLTGSGDAQAVEDFTKKIHSVRSSIAANAQGRLKAYNYEFKPAQTPNKASDGAGTIKVRRASDGKVAEVPASRRSAYENDPRFQVLP